MWKRASYQQVLSALPGEGLALAAEMAKTGRSETHKVADR